VENVIPSFEHHILIIMAPTATPSATATVAMPPDQNVGPALLIVTGILTAFIVITTGARVFVRAKLRVLGWDDHTILLSTVCAILRLATQALQVSHGNGRHMEYLEKKDITASNMYGFYAMILLFASICFLKTSIILLLLRIRNSRRLRHFLYAVIAGLYITNFGSIFIIIAQCNPPSAYWTGKGKCWDIRVRIYYIYVTIGWSSYPFRISTFR
jgi:hypothetical protein